MEKGLKKQLEENKQSGLKDSIKIFFMENFRKLAMGLQAQIDSLDRRLAAKTVPTDLDFYGLPFSDGLTLAVTVKAADVVMIYE